MYPVIPFNGRTSERDTVLPTGGGPDGKSPIFLPKGGVIVYNAYAMHRSPALWGPDALEFKPERWEKESKLPSKFVPFGGGSRICPGRESYRFYISHWI
jgi:cytochrome P450